MHWSATSINRIINSVNELKEKCSTHCRELKKAAADENFELVKNVEKREFSGVVGAIDSGFSSRQFLSLEVMLLRSAGSIFTYDKNMLVNSRYFPNRVPGISVHSSLLADPSDSLHFKSLSRLSAELNCAIQVAKIYQPSLLLVDGSLLPLPTDRPAGQNSTFCQHYNEVIALFNELFATSRENNCTLVGIVKDSHSQKMCNLLTSKFKRNLPAYSDEFLANSLLTGQQRTSCFKLDQTELSESELYCFYMKSGSSLPYRVEFQSKKEVEKKATEIAGNLQAISSTQFAYPSILIEVDMRAALTPGEINALFKTLDGSARDLVLRSNSRPFR